jgi:predicted pyridoxine 5'-phosphate oxidase superfamily flavin-nucleotide-binding protein
MKMTEEVQKLITEGIPAMVATADRSGKPNVSPKGSLRILDDETIYFGDTRSPQTVANLKENPKIAILSYNPTTMKGARVWGRAEVITSGPLFDQVDKATFERRKMHINSVVRILVQEVKVL